MEPPSGAAATTSKPEPPPESERSVGWSECVCGGGGGVWCVDKLPPPPSLPPLFFFFFQIRSKAIGRTWTPLRPNDTFPPLLSSAGTSARLRSPEASTHSPSITSHLFFFFYCAFFFKKKKKNFIPTAHPVSCIALLQSLFWARCEPGTHQQGSCHRRPPARAQPLWIQEEKDGVSCLQGTKIKRGGKKKNPSRVIFLKGIFLFFLFCSFQFLTGCSVLLAGKCMF